MSPKKRGLGRQLRECPCGLIFVRYRGKETYLNKEEILAEKLRGRIRKGYCRVCDKVAAMFGSVYITKE
jgi:hypothetical protein